MSQTIQIRRRNSGAAGAPPSLAAGEMAWSAVDRVLYFGSGDNGAGVASSIVALAGPGAYLLASLVGAANGLASLDASGKLPSAQLPAAIVGAMVYQGVWDASRNSPALASGQGTKGQYYKVAAAGSTALDGNTAWAVGDMIVFDGAAWDKIDGPAEAVTTVAGRIGAVTLSSADLTDASAVGRSLLAAATLAAQRAALRVDARTAVADAAYQLTAADFNVQYTSITAARTATLPAAGGVTAGTRVEIGDGSGACSSSNTITVAPSGSDTINGSTGYVIAAGYGQVALQSDGASRWVIKGQTAPQPSNVDGGSY